MSDRSIIHHNKLVRDRIPEIIARDGRTCCTEILNDLDYQQALLAKLVEEAQEVIAAEPSERVKELADLFEVIEALVAALDLDRQTILDTQMSRRARIGGFENRIKLLWTE